MRFVALKIAKRAVEYSVRLRKMNGHCGGLGAPMRKKGAAGSLRTEDVGAPTNVGSFALQEKMVKWYTWTTWHFIGLIARDDRLEEGAAIAVAEYSPREMSTM
jgi:hypothetical protein